MRKHFLRRLWKDFWALNQPLYLPYVLFLSGFILLFPQTVMNMLLQYHFHLEKESTHEPLD